MSTYEPGTLAVATVRGVPNVRVMRIPQVPHDFWLSAATVNGEHWHRDSEVTDVRPLVTLDLSADDLRDAASCIQGHTARNCEVVERIANQIEAQTRPPTPEEPTGLGAVVEDSHGERYTRIGVHDDDSTWACARTGNHFSWLAIPAVRILSEGWSE